MHRVRRIGEAIVGELPVARDFHQPRPVEVPKVPGDGRLREVEELDQVTDAQLPRHQEAENTNAGRIGKSLEQEIQISDAGSGECQARLSYSCNRIKSAQTDMSRQAI